MAEMGSVSPATPLYDYKLLVFCIVEQKSKVVLGFFRNIAVIFFAISRYLNSPVFQCIQMHHLL